MAGAKQYGRSCVGHGCILFDFTVEGSSSNRGTSAVFSGACHGLPWEFPRQGPRVPFVRGASTASATVVTMARVVVLSVTTSVGSAMATHGSTTATATAYSMVTSTSIAAAIHGNKRRMPRHCTAIATAILPRQVPCGNCVGTPRQLPRECPRTSLHRNFQGKPRHSVVMRGNWQSPRQLPR